MPEIKDTDWAYAAGFVDGEGCIAIVRHFAPARNRFYYGIQVVVANTDRRALDWMQQNWAGRVFAVTNSRGGGRNSWTWRCGSEIARSFLVGIRPWLKNKPAQCDNAVAMLELLLRTKRTLGPHSIPLAWLEEQEQLYWIQRKLNHRGTAPFVAQAMHSPRAIHRRRLMGG